ncbi:GntR family transcriptional regulator [Rhodobacteraceae bacterium NNCM2]|nr:GntR family transcriptional regulator [Coraliihabitans acroporae]
MNRIARADDEDRPGTRMNTTVKLSRASLSEQIRDHLLDQIIAGDLPPGERLKELKIAAEMQTSQAPVREALKELEALGLVEVVRNRGARVRIIDDEELREIYDVRAQLEGYAAERVTETGAAIGAELKDIRNRMLEAAEAGDSMAFSEHNLIFHRAIIEATGNRTLLEHWERLNIKVQTFINVQRKHSDLRRIAMSHDRIIDAIEAGDAAEARLAGITHVKENRP